MGNETALQAPLVRPQGRVHPTPWFTGQRMLAGRDARNSAVWPALESPAGWGADRGTQGMLAPMASRGQGVGALAWVAKKAPKSVPDDAVESLETIVLLIRFTTRESCNDTPLPASATLPIIRLALTTRLRPMPSPTVPKAWLQSVSGSPGQVGSVSGALMMRRPPPLLGVVGLVAWLNRIVLCWMLLSQLNPSSETPAPSPVLKFPHTQL